MHLHVYRIMLHKQLYKVSMRVDRTTLLWTDLSVAVGISSQTGGYAGFVVVNV